MKTRMKKKTQKELGYVLIAAYIPIDMKTALNRRAASNHRSTSAEITLILESALKGSDAF